MSEWVLPAPVLASALAVTHLCSLRPMRSGGRHSTWSASASRELERELRQARAERDRLRAQ